MKNYLIGLAALLLLSFPAQIIAQDQDHQGQDQEQNQDQNQAPDQGQNQNQNQDQPPSSVARVSFIRGDVSTQRGDSGDWNAATLNTPVMAGDRVSTGANSRAEVQLDYANILRLDQNSAASVANLTQSQLQVQVGQGVADYSLLKGSQAQVEIDTPNAAVHPQNEGQYRIEVISNEETRVTVLKGGADVTTPQGSAHVDAGQMMTVQGTTSPQYQVSDARSRDDFDKWNNDRDKLITNAASWSHTNPYYTGTQDLDAYGRWVSAPDYGSVWVPSQAPGWAPYSAGRWVWEPYYGWTWVSYEPWGWAPYHYGRWFLYGNSWAWWPGPVYGGYRPIWAPAYVSFFGFGRGWGFNVGFGGGWGFGSFGWLPIGPGDWFRPWWGRWGGNRVNVVNITNITIINNRFRGQPPLTARGFSNLNSVLTNERVRRGISTMPTKDFGRTSVPSQTRSLDAATLRQASAMTGRLPAVPTKDSLRSVDRPASPGTIPSRAVENQRFFSKSTPPAVSRTFNQQAAETQRMVNSSRTDMNRPTATSGTPALARRETMQTQTGRQPSSGGGFGANNPRGNTSPAQGVSTQREGWHNFGASGQISSGAGFGPPREQTPAPRSPDAGWHSFSGQGGAGSPRGGQPPQQGQSAPRPAPNPKANQAPRGQSTPTARPGANAPNSAPKGAGWQPFKPQPPAPSSAPSGQGARGTTTGPSPRPGWQSFSPAPRGSSQPGGTPRMSQPSYGSRGPSNSGYSRPPLQLRQPIVTQRPTSPYGGYGRSQGNSGPPSGGARPSGGGRPSGGSAPSPHPSGGHPPSGGSGSHGGSGGHSGGGGHR